MGWLNDYTVIVYGPADAGSEADSAPSYSERLSPEVQDMLPAAREISTDSPEFEELCESLRNCSTWQLISKLNAERAEHVRQMAALRKWIAGGRKGLLAPELKAKWLELALEHDGIEAAAREMDRLAAHKMPEVLQ